MRPFNACILTNPRFFETLKWDGLCFPLFLTKFGSRGYLLVWHSVSWGLNKPVTFSFFYINVKGELLKQIALIFTESLNSSPSLSWINI